MIPNAALFATAALALGVTNAPLDAQCSPVLPVRTDWWPRRYVRDVSHTSASDRTVIEATLAQAEAIVRKTAYGTPHGFEVEPWWVYDPPASRNRLGSYRLDIRNWCRKTDEHGADIVITFNPDPVRFSEGDRAAFIDEKGDGLFLERVRSETRFGAAATYGNFDEPNTEGLFVLLTADGEFPTLPVTREEFLQAKILAIEGKNPVPGIAAVTDRFRAELAAMTPQERASPAFVFGTQELVPAGTPNAMAVVRANPAFYRARRSPVEPRAVLVQMPNTYPELKAQHWQMYREFDWDGLKRLLDTRP